MLIADPSLPKFLQLIDEASSACGIIDMTFWLPARTHPPTLIPLLQRLNDLTLQEDPRVMNCRAETESPRLSPERNERVEPNEEASKIETQLAKFVLVVTDRPDPTFMNPRMDREEPPVTKSRTDATSPSLASERREQEEPTFTNWKIDASPATRAFPNIEIALPARTAPRIDMALAILTKSRTVTDDPSLVKDLMEQLDPPSKCPSTLCFLPM
jgi:hypothetical protein